MAGLLFSVACNEDSQVVELASPSTPESQLQSRTDGADNEGELGDNTNAAERAATTAALIESLREGEDVAQTFTWPSIADELETMVNYYGSDVGNEYGDQETILLEYDLGSPTNANVLAFYENVRTDILQALTAYDNSQVTTSMGLIFVAITVDETEDSGNKGYVVASVGEAGSAEPTLDNDFKWADETGPALNACQFRDKADEEITKAANRSLTGAASTVVGTTPGRIIPEIRGLVNVAFSAEEPGYARNVSFATLDQRGFPAGTTGYNSNLIPCQLADFTQSGQYRIHYDCNSDELCFDQGKFDQYFSDYQSIGNNEARAIARQNIRTKFFRIGAYVDGFIAGVDNGGSFTGRTHTATYYYGDRFTVETLPLMF